MKNFNWTQFTRQIGIKASLAQVYDAWTKSSEIEKWFLSKAQYFDTKNNLVDSNSCAEAGFTYEWNWYLYDISERGKITEANGKDFFQFTFAGNCIVEVKLTERKENVLLSLTQKNIPTDDVSKEDIRLGCESGWSFYIVNLKSVYEGGLDLRNKNPDLRPMVNN